MNTQTAASLALRGIAFTLAMAALVGRDPSAGTMMQAPPVVTVPNLMGYWPLDETALGTAADLSGLGNDGMHVNSPTISTSLPPMANHAANQRSLSFLQANGTSVNIPTSSSLSLTGSFTLSAWINPSTPPAVTQHGILEKWDPFSPYPNGYSMRLDTNHNLSVNVHSASGPNGVSTIPRAIPLNTWTHVAATFNASGGVLLLYVNGVQDPSTASGLALPSAGTAPLMIGEAQGANRFQGLIDETRIYNRALTPTEIDLLRTGQPAPTGLVAAGAAGMIQLSWSAPVGAPASTTYSLLRGTAPGVYDTVFNGINGTTYDDTTVTPGTPYFYVVVAVTALASDNSPEVSASAAPAGPPPPPPPPRTEKLGNRHMCGCSTITPGCLLPGALAAALLLLALVLRR